MLANSLPLRLRLLYDSGTASKPTFKRQNIAAVLSRELKTLNIRPGREGDLSDHQKTFNAHIKQLKKLRAMRAGWEAANVRYQQRYTRELLPLLEKWTASRTTLLHALDSASERSGLSRTERRKIAGLITELAGGLLAERDDAQLKALYNKHAPRDFDSEQRAGLAEAKEMLEDVLGIELGDEFDMGAPEELLERAQQSFEDEQQAWQARQAKRKKTAKQLDRQERQQAEQTRLSQSIREVYRKLASALHPDRETNPQERERKTSLMQRVNQAYAQNNLLLLLELQIELEHIDQDDLARFTEEKLIRYNAILKQQVRALQNEVRSCQDGFRMQFGISPFVELSAHEVMRHLDGEIASVTGSVREIERDLRSIEELPKLKAWLKRFRHRPLRDRLGEALF